MMAVVAIIRVSKIHGAENVDVVWEIFWQYMKGSIAVLMASVTTFRALFVDQQRQPREPQEKKRTPSYSWPERIKGKRSASNVETRYRLDLSSLPRATLTSMRTFIRRNNRSARASTLLDIEAMPIEKGE